MTRMVNAMVAQLSGTALDWAVALADGFKASAGSACILWRWTGTMKSVREVVRLLPDHAHLAHGEKVYSPSTDWSQLGPLISKYGMQFTTPVSGGITAWPYGRPSAATHGPDHLVAACRSIVVAELGEVISVPAELVEGE